ncbi:MAG: NAD-dependent epimerase/dehydratase family protein [Bacteriovoracia bacterium]
MKEEKRPTNILVTGGAGYLGSVLVPMLLEQGYHVRMIDCFYFGDEHLKSILNHPNLEVIRDDILNHENHPNLFKNIDCVVHLAGVSNDPTSDLDPNLTVRVNYFATISLARRAKTEGVPHFIFMSSCSVYGGGGNQKLTETSETGPLTLYALTKLQSEPGLLKLCSPDFSVTIFRLATLFGYSPRMRFDLAINVMVKRAIQGLDIMVNGGGEQYRPFLHVRDAAEAIEFAIRSEKNKISGEIYNVGRDDMNYTIANLAKEIHHAFPKVNLKTVPQNADLRSYNVSFDKIKSKLGFMPKRVLKDAILEIVNANKKGDLKNMDDKRFYNLALLKTLNLSVDNVYSPASTQQWSEVTIRSTEPNTNVVPLKKKKVIAMILAYNVGKMLPRALQRIPRNLVDDIIVMDDGSSDNTSEVAKQLGLKVFRHEPNRGYGGNVKAGLQKAFELGADYVVEIHGDGAQFDPVAIRDAIPLMAQDVDLILGSRFQKPMTALKNGMPLIRFFANIYLSFFDRLVLGLPLTEFHTGFRIYSRHLFETVPYEQNSNDYLFSFQIIAQAAFYGKKVGEVPVEADYKSEHTSHSVRGATKYAFQTFGQLFSFLLAKWGMKYNKIFKKLTSKGDLPKNKLKQAG